MSEDVNHRIARRLRGLRAERGYSLDALAERSGVSRSNISLIENARSSPTAAVLDRLAAGLGVTLASFFEAGPAGTGAAPPSPLSRAADQPVWTDPASGYVRRNVSPALPAPLQLVAVEFPPGRRVAYDTGARAAHTHQQVWLVEGAMEVSVGAEQWRLAAGDCLAMTLDERPIVYRNPGRSTARYLVALVAPGAAAVTPRTSA
jgi:transcriptional regulator with XRE-family HTH domain